MVEAVMAFPACPAGVQDVPQHRVHHRTWQSHGGLLSWALGELFGPRLQIKPVAAQLFSGSLAPERVQVQRQARPTRPAVRGPVAAAVDQEARLWCSEHQEAASAASPLAARAAMALDEDIGEVMAERFVELTLYAKKRSNGYAQEERPHAQEPDSESGEDKEDDRLYALPSVYLAELPINITENGVRHILQEVDAYVPELVAVNFLQQKSKGSHRCCLLRYPNLETAEEVAQRVNGFMVYHPDDKTRPVRAKVAKHARMFNQFCTDVYVGEVPFDWNASAVYRLLAEAGIERGAVHSVKLLSLRPGRSTVGVILRVVDGDAADEVMERLNGYELIVRGKPRPLKARLADAPQWPEAPESRKPAPKQQMRRPRDQTQLQ
ncbi:unnamed protein product [Symbiodinium natans]|uniref:RRM domain-containing protein n=1 Tax=Symbiodinium natans TaxID=878477 RepID=A0A812HY31_9DINO|nr:unnamed protein product [Symbiodinium natans]